MDITMDTEMEQAQARLRESDRNLFAYWGPEVSEQELTAIFHRGAGFPAFGFNKSLVLDLVDRCLANGGPVSELKQGDDIYNIRHADDEVRLRCVLCYVADNAPTADDTKRMWPEVNVVLSRLSKRALVFASLDVIEIVPPASQIRLRPTMLFGVHDDSGLPGSAALHNR